MTEPATSRENRWLGDAATRVALPAGIGGAALLAVGALIAWRSDLTWERFLRAYLVAFVFVLSLSLGGLFFTMLQHLTRAGWSVVLRRLAEGLAGCLQWIWILFIPIVIGLYTTDLYHWTHPSPDDHLLAHKAPFLNETFWLVRAAFYFTVWGLLARYFLKSSIAQDETGDPRITLRMETVAAPGMILYAFTQTFAVIDWVMAIEPHWYSTMFGVYYFAATCCGFGSTMIILCWLLQRSGRLRESITREHYQDMGKFLFAFGIVFWAYIAYSQYMLIWYANIPEETTWMMARNLGDWKLLSRALAIGHFAVPFIALISRIPKRLPGMLAIAAGWMLVIHYLDMYWLAMPDVPAELIASAATYAQVASEFEASYPALNLSPHIVDLLCVAGLGGIFAAIFAGGMRGVALIPLRDPRLGESMAFENY